MDMGERFGISKEQIKRMKQTAKINNRKRSRVFGPFYQEALRVASLTTKYDNSLMWSHYSDSDRGICIGYSMPNYKYNSYIFPTLYSKNILDLSDLGDPTNWHSDRSFFPMICCGIVKQSIWSYENEWRLMMPWGDFQFLSDSQIPRLPVDSPRISRVFLGPSFIGYWVQAKHNKAPNGSNRISELKKYFYPFCDFVKRNNIPVYSMKINPGHYKLEVSKRINIDALRDLDSFYIKKYYKVPTRFASS